MMRIADLFMVISFAAPLSSSLTCVALLVVRYLEKDRYGRTKHNKLLMHYLLLLSLTCGLVLLYLYFPGAGNTPFCVLFMLSSMYSVVLLYHIIHRIMSMSGQPPISRLHYFIPLTVTIGYLLLFRETATGTESSGISEGLSSGVQHPAAFSFSYWELIAYKVVYSLIILKRLFTYRRQVINHRPAQKPTFLNWLLWIIGINFILIPLSALQLMLSKHHFLIPLTNMLIMLQSTLLFCNMFTNNYIKIIIDRRGGGSSGSSKNSNRKPMPDPISPVSFKIDKQHFEDYISREKPFLNPELKITDMILPLGTNRTYLSRFINNTYGMSFSHYINTCRAKELDSYLSDPQMSKYTNEDKIIMAGFSGKRGYKRFVKEWGGATKISRTHSKRESGNQEA